MPSLEQIVEKKDAINLLADLFGFKQVRICKESDSYTLIFLLSVIQDKPSYRLLFEAAMSKILDCHVVILVEKNLKALYVANIVKNAVSIDDKLGIEAVFNSSLADISFVSIAKDQESRVSQERALQMADSIVFEQTHKTLADFFKL